MVSLLRNGADGGVAVTRDDSENDGGVGVSDGMGGGGEDEGDGGSLGGDIRGGDGAGSGADVDGSEKVVVINYGGGAVDGKAEVMEEALMAEVTVAVEMVSEMDVRCLGWKWWALCRG